MSAQSEPNCGWCGEEEGVVCTSASGKLCCYECAKTCKHCQNEPMAPDDEACAVCRAEEGSAARCAGCEEAAVHKLVWSRHTCGRDSRIVCARVAVGSVSGGSRERPRGGQKEETMSEELDETERGTGGYGSTGR